MKLSSEFINTILIISILAISACASQSPKINSFQIQEPLIKPYAATYEVKEDGSPTYFANYTSDGKGHLRIDDSGDFFTLYDCQLKRESRFCKSKKTYLFYDKTINPLNMFILPGLINEAFLQDETPDYRDLSTIIASYTGNPRGIKYTNSLVTPTFVGTEQVKSYICHHYMLTESAGRANTETWYSPELNCCVKMTSYALGKSQTSTLSKYLDKINPAVFDVSDYRLGPASEFYKNLSPK